MTGERPPANAPSPASKPKRLPVSSAAPSLTANRLLRVLLLEKDLGYTDRAVRGGLDLFLAQWRQQPGDAAGPASQAQVDLVRILPVAYKDLPPHERAAWIALFFGDQAPGIKPNPSLRGPAKPGSSADHPTNASLRGSAKQSPHTADAEVASPGAGSQGQIRGALAADEVGTNTPLRGSAKQPHPTAHAEATTTGAPKAVARELIPRSPPSPPKLLAAGQSLDTPLSDVKGFLPDLVEKLGRRGATTVRELLYYFPARHIDFSATRPISSLQVGEDQTAVGVVWESSTLQLGKNPRKRTTQVIVGDDTGTVRAVWFNQPWMAGTLKAGMRVALSGRVNEFRGKKCFDSPEYDIADERDSAHTGRLVPIYALTAGLTPRRMRNAAKRVLDGAASLAQEFLPADMRQRLDLIDLAPALRAAHFPTDEAEKDASRHRLALDELLVLQLGVLARKKAWKEAVPSHPLRPDRQALDAFMASLPFALTGAQQRVIGEVLADLEKSTAMSRIIQGEVGSGKTVVALVAILAVASSRQQIAFMAPTELLAEQHFRTVRALLAGLAQPSLSADFFSVRLGAEEVANMPAVGAGLQPAFPSRLDTAGQKPMNVALLTGSTSRKRKEELHQMTAQGAIDLLIGTHALFQKDVVFSDLGLVIVDEQHRFGVMQRTELRQKGHNPHLLVMTATPIPRSLALTLYGDLDLSTIDELPPGRLAIKTLWLDASRREEAYGGIRREVERGRQAFIIYPLVEESEKVDVAAATEEHQRLSHDVFSELRVGLLHGRMRQKEKDEVMLAFRAGTLDVLVSTAVVEVGIDVPNATVMMIDWADRFGLAQLHQFRGRVGRGAHQSYCILISHEPSSVAGERLRILERVHDGFALAEEDLRLRGAGEFFGTRQSGLPDLRMARISDAKLLETARAEAARLFAQDPQLRSPEHQGLAQEVSRAWARRTFAPGEA